MARITAFIATITIFFQCLFGIGGMKLGQVTLVPERHSYPVGTEAITAVLTNGTRERIITAPYAYSLERWEDGKWISVALKDSVVIPIETGPVHPYESLKKIIRLTDHESVIVGRYRIRGLEASETPYAEFEIVGPGVTLTTKSASYPLGTETIQATWYNGTGQTFWFGRPFALEQWDGSQWITVEPREPVDFTMEVYPVEPLQSVDTAYGLSHYDLQTGRYRIKTGMGGAAIYAVFELK